jgi:hypothetical protein
VRELSKLYTRALRSRPKIVGIACEDSAPNLLEASDRGFLLVNCSTSGDASRVTRERLPTRFREIALGSSDGWERIIGALTGKH